MIPTPAEDGRIRRDPKRFYGGIFVAVLLVTFAAYVWMGASRHWILPFMVSLFVLVGLIYTSLLVFMPGVGNCPECAFPMTGLSLSQNEGRECRGCQLYIESTDGVLRASTSKSVAAFAVFEVPCPEGAITWPEGCCVCGAATTRWIDVKLDHKQDAAFGKSVAVGVASAGLLKAVEKRSFQAQVPHCDVHDNGAEIGFSIRNQLPYMSFRAKKYADEFAEQNEAPAAWTSYQ